MQWEALDEQAKELKESGIIFVIVCDLGLSIFASDIPNALVVSIDRLKDYSDKYIFGVKDRTYYFEELLIGFRDKLQNQI